MVTPEENAPTNAEWMVQSAVHKRRLAEPSENERYTDWWVMVVIDAVRDLPVAERMDLLGMVEASEAIKLGTTLPLYMERRVHG